MPFVQYWNLDNLRRLPRAPRRLLLIRHSSRDKLNYLTEDVYLTTAGTALARQYGQTLAAQKIQISHLLASSRIRCLQTGYEILLGTGNVKQIHLKVSDIIHQTKPQKPKFLPPAYLEELLLPELRNFMQDETVHMDQNYLINLLGEMQEYFGEDAQSIGLIVAHDATLVLLYRLFFQDLDYTLEKQRPAFLDGMLFVQETEGLRIILPAHEVFIRA